MDSIGRLSIAACFASPGVVGSCRSLVHTSRDCVRSSFCDLLFSIHDEEDRPVCPNLVRRLASLSTSSVHHDVARAKAILIVHLQSGPSSFGGKNCLDLVGLTQL